MDKNYKSGFAAIIGRPNVGKSTLMNQLIGQKIAITSKKPQTTRNKIQTVYTCDRGQIVFQDTPGIHKAKNKLGEYMVQVARKTLEDVDVILWLVEPTTFIGAGEKHIAQQLEKANKPVLLVINKVDTIKKEEVLAVIDTYRKLYDFQEIVPVSALRGQNTEDLIDTIFRYLPYGPQFYDEDTVTDQPQRQIAAEVIREKALHALDEEIPHGIAVTVEKMRSRPGGKICDRGHHRLRAGIPQGNYHRPPGQHAEKDRQQRPLRAGADAGDEGEPEAVGEGAQGLAGQRYSDEEFRLQQKGNIRDE